MVLIISNENDTSTNHVIEWLEYFNVKWLRINKENKIELAFLKNDIELKSDCFKIKLSEINSYWYRRGSINNYYLNIRSFNGLEDLELFLYEENYYLRSYFYYLLDKKKNLNSFLNSSVNKLIITDIADDFGLKVPKSYLIDSKNELLKINKKIITKTISGNPHVKIKNKNGVMFTSIIDDKSKITDFFAPSLLQENIFKKYELRIFYLDGKFYSMAIFSQNDTNTSIDFRKYNKTKPNRNVPFNLPNRIEKKLDSLMKKILINCGSIDMIVTPENEYYFLEVNPVGQFGMISNPCNYNLEKKIANYIK